MSGGGIKATINHDVMKNVKVKHLRWWFENIDNTTTFNGQDFKYVSANFITGPVIKIDYNENDKCIECRR